MGCKVISVANNKGGVGKTTTVATLGYAWAKKGYKVLLVDLDAQANLTLLTSPVDIDDISITVASPLIYKVEPDILPVRDNLSLIPSGLSLANFELDTSRSECREFLLADMLEPLKEKFDIILIDCPPALGLLSYNALVASDYLVLTSTADRLSYEGLIMMLNLANKIMGNSRLNPNLQIAGVVVTKFKKNKLNNSFFNMMEADFKETMIMTPIREVTKMQQANSCGKSIFDYDPSGNAAQDYQAVADELEKRMFTDK